MHRLRSFQSRFLARCARRVDALKQSLYGRGQAVALAMATLFSLALGAGVDSRLFALAAATGVGLTIGLIWPRLSLLGVEADLEFDRERIREGESAVLRLRARNRMPWPVWSMEVQGITLPEDTRDVGIAQIVVHLPPCSRRTFNWTLDHLPRGVYPATAPLLACRFPFGLATAQHALRTDRSLTVWPRTYVAPSLPATIEEREREGPLCSQRAGHSGDVIGVRPWRQGDSLRRVHWAQTARHDRMIVCEMQATRWPRVQVLLYLNGAPGGPDSTREWCIRVAATLCRGWVLQGAEVSLRLMDAGHEQTVTGAPEAMLDALARLPAISPSACGSHDPGMPFEHPAGTVLVIPGEALERVPAHTGIPVVLVGHPVPCDSSPDLLALPADAALPVLLQMGWKENGCRSRQHVSA
ncbi:MAG: DUF58 domain-containing protein [Chloroherpetonaceae bacterium]|nr:DUF58 domain-containing protein [Chthonomonadaceae bacterium]MDW8206902.1 DUF58 domain-containing protein [Chloroherpetonaceae bacterium]